MEYIGILNTYHPEIPEFKYSNSCKLKLPAKPFALAFLINHIGRVTSTQRWLSWQRGRDARHYIRKASAKYATGTLPPKRVLSRSFTFFHNQHQSTTSHCCSRRQKGCMLQLFQARLSQASVFGIQSQLKGFGAHDDRSIPSTKANRKKCLGRWRFKGTGSICISYRSFCNICTVYVCVCVCTCVSSLIYTYFVTRLFYIGLYIILSSALPCRYCVNCFQTIHGTVLSRFRGELSRTRGNSCAMSTHTWQYHEETTPKIVNASLDTILENLMHCNGNSNCLQSLMSLSSQHMQPSLTLPAPTILNHCQANQFSEVDTFHPITMTITARVAFG